MFSHNLNFAPGRLRTSDDARKKPRLKSAVLFSEPSCRETLPVKREKMLLLHAGWGLVFFSLFCLPLSVILLAHLHSLSKEMVPDVIKDLTAIASKKCPSEVLRFQRCVDLKENDAACEREDTEAMKCAALHILMASVK